MNWHQRWHRFWFHPVVSWGELLVIAVFWSLMRLLPDTAYAIVTYALLLSVIVLKARQYRIVRRKP